MSDPTAAVVEALLRTLRADTALLALLGAPRVYDRAPREAVAPFVVVDSVTTSDWSTATEPGSEHRVVLDVWTRGGGRRPAGEIADAVRRALTLRPLAGVRGHRIVSVTHRETALTVEPGDVWRARLVVRALTEPTD
jgi:hypothetical protein